jgi:hypothetical protein
MNKKEQKMFNIVWKGKGLYDNTDFTLVKYTDKPEDTDLKENFGTCWIGDKENFNEILKNL